MNCTKCGNELEQGAKFCSYCGALAEEAQVTIIAEEAATGLLTEDEPTSLFTEEDPIGLFAGNAPAADEEATGLLTENEAPVFADAAPQQEAYVAPQQEAYVAPQQEAYVAPQQEAYVAPQQEAYVAPQQEAYVAPQQNAYTAPQQNTYTAPQQNYYTAPQQNYYAAPQQNTYTVPQQNYYTAPQQAEPMSWKEFYKSFASKGTKSWVTTMVVISFVTAGLSLILLCIGNYLSILDLLFYGLMGILILANKRPATTLIPTIYGGVFSLIGMVSGGIPSGIFAIFAGIMSTIALNKLNKAYKEYRNTGILPNSQI